MTGLHGIGTLLEILGIAGAALVLAVVLPRRLARYSVATGGTVLLAVLAWETVPYPWVGTAERASAILLVSWVAVIGSWLTPQRHTTPLVSALPASPPP